MAWENIPTTRDAAKGYASTNVPNYAGTAYGMNRPGNWESGWSPTGQMSQRPYEPGPRGRGRPARNLPSRFSPNTSIGYNRSGLGSQVNPGQGRYYSGDPRGTGQSWITKKGIASPGVSDVKGKYIRGDEEDDFAFTDEGLGKNIMQDAGRMLTDLTPDVRMPGILGIFGDLTTSVGKNREHHKFINSRLGRASPQKNLAFFGQQGFLDAARTMNAGMLTEDGEKAWRRFNSAGVTDNVLEKFMDPGYKFYGNEAWLRSQAHDKDKFDDGMSFIKHAKASANLARNMATQERSQMAAQVDPGGRMEEFADLSRDARMDRDLFGDPDKGYEGNLYDREKQIKDLEDQTIEDITADLGGEDYTPYPDEKWGAPINYNPYRDEDYGAPLYGFRKGRKSNLASLFGIPAFMDTEESYGLMPGAELPYNMNEDEEINPDMLNPDYFNQFTPG